MESRDDWIALVLGFAGLAILLGLAGNWLGCAELAGLGSDIKASWAVWPSRAGRACWVGCECKNRALEPRPDLSCASA